MKEFSWSPMARFVGGAIGTVDARYMREGLIAAFERSSDLSLAPQQRRAIEAAARDKCVVITGGPGVGKTTIVRGILGILQAANRVCALAAPTGRAGPETPCEV